jgi:hypothetical protein
MARRPGYQPAISETRTLAEVLWGHDRGTQSRDGSRGRGARWPGDDAPGTGRGRRRLTGSPRFAQTLVQSSWGTILKPAAFAGRLCFAPNLGQHVRFTNPASWVT